MITITAFKWVPPFAQGLVRDLRARWALEEAGVAYRVRLIDSEDQSSAEYRAMQPFGQVPVLEEDGLVLFESGAIVLHVGERSEALLPADAARRAHAVMWLLAALNSVETFVQQLAVLDLFYADQEWAKARRPGLEGMVKTRLSDLEARLGDSEYLDGQFTAGDLMMTTVLRTLRHTDLLDALPRLKAYKERCEARPAFQKALSAQLAAFKEHAPPGAAA